jgi:hypothetical protein
VAAFSEAYIAASQSGKSTLLGQLRFAPRSELPPRVLVWDFKREHAGLGRLAPSISVLCELARAPSYRIVFQPSFDDRMRAKQFDWFCSVAVDSVAEDKVRTLLMVEELAFVTSPASAPAPWRQATCTGLGLGLSVIGTSQFPAQIDKSFFGNTTDIYCGRLTEPAHVEKMSKVLGVPYEQINALPPYRFLHRDVTRPGEIVPVTTKKPRGKAAPTP